MASIRTAASVTNGAGPSASGSTSATAASANVAAPTATHVHASSLALLEPDTLSQVLSRLSTSSRSASTLLQREVVCQRIDDLDPQRIEMERDPMYQPIRRARQQNRLRVHFERGQVDLRLYSKPAGKTLDYVDVHNLVLVLLEGEPMERHIGAAQKAAGMNGLPLEVDAGQGAWSQIIQAMGWIPQHTVLRKGHRFILVEEPTCQVEVWVFQLMQTTTEGSMQRIADTQLLYVTASLPFKPKSNRTQETTTVADAAQLSERAQKEIAAVQDLLKGFVKLNKEYE